MLNIKRLAQLTKRLQRPVDELAEIIEQRDRYVEELHLCDPRKPDKPRDVISVGGQLREVQDLFYSTVLLPKLIPIKSSHGGIRGRSIKTNVRPHAQSGFVFKADLANFYPSISAERVRVHLLKDLGCSATVADSLARLCTYNDHLALGLVTSPLLSDSILKAIDVRLLSACRNMGLVYTRYVDDLTISGDFDLSASGVSALVQKVLRSHGFQVNEEKLVFGRLEETPITGVRVRNGRLDVESSYALELDRQLNDAESLSANGEFNGPFYTENQIRGRVTHVCWVNRGRAGGLAKRLAAIDWKEHAAEGKRRGLVKTKSTLVRRPARVECGS